MKFSYKRRGGPIQTYDGSIPPASVRAGELLELGGVPFAYQRRGGPMRQWMRAGETRELAGLGHTDYAFQRRGGPSYEWDGGRPPYQAGVATSVGAEMPDDLEDGMFTYEYVVPPPGAPEELTGLFYDGSGGNVNIDIAGEPVAGSRKLVAIGTAIVGYQRGGLVNAAIWGLLGYLFPVPTAAAAILKRKKGT